MNSEEALHYARDRLLKEINQCEIAVAPITLELIQVWALAAIALKDM